MPASKRKTIMIESMDDFTRFMSKNRGAVSDSDDIGKQINTIRDQASDLRSLNAYIDDHKNDLRGVLTPSVRLAQEAVNNRIQKLEEKIQNLEELDLKRKNFAGRVVIPADDGEYAGNGKCYIQFVNVGMGDCSLITTPSGKTIMIDLGSSSQSDVSLGNLIPGSSEEIIRSSVTSKYFLNGGDTIDILLLTHQDADHHNLLQTILKGYISEINMVYYGGSENFSDYAPASAYVTELAGKGTIRKVLLREEDVKYSDPPAVSKVVGDKPLGKTKKAPDVIGSEFVDPLTGEIVLYYEEVAGKVVFRLSVLASNIIGLWTADGKRFVVNDTDVKTAGEMKLNGTPNNIRSLVILLECHGQKILVTGDGTALTEAFVVRYFSDILKNVSYLRFGHHGSPTSSLRAFIAAQTSLKMAVASTGGKSTVVHNLPKKNIISEYDGKTPGKDTVHYIYGFSNESLKIQPIGPIKENLFATGSNGTVQFVIDKAVSKVLLHNKLILEHFHDHNI
jgi:beta-lactamase superfamily II metal-dependent hydrolase